MRKCEKERCGYEAAVIGVSAGGLNALSIVLSSLSKDLRMSLMVVQHSHPDSGDFLARHLSAICPLTVKPAEEKESIGAGVVYMAPANYHLLVETDRTLSLSIDALVNYARPSVDVLFESASDTYGAALIGIILTGANVDGSRGLKAVKEAGGLAVVQEPDTAEADVMPRAALAAVQVDHVLTLEKIPILLNRLGSDGRSRERVDGNE